MRLEDRLRSRIREIPDFPRKGISFKDIMPVFKDVELLDDTMEEFRSRLSHHAIDAVCGIESRGFLLGILIAHALKVPFVPIRKEGKLPGDTIAFAYSLEYGKAVIEMQKDALEKGMQVLIHDDLLATGGTAAAAASLVEMQGARVSAFAFLVELLFLEGRKTLHHYTNDIITFVQYKQ